MSADIIQIRDYQNKKDFDRMNAEIERQAIEIMNVALCAEPGMIGMSPEPKHCSSCAIHNAPALPVGPCDCGMYAPI